MTGFRWGQPRLPPLFGSLTLAALVIVTALFPPLTPFLLGLGWALHLLLGLSRVAAHVGWRLTPELFARGLAGLVLAGSLVEVGRLVFSRRRLLLVAALHAVLLRLARALLELLLSGLLLEPLLLLAVLTALLVGGLLLLPLG